MTLNILQNMRINNNKYKKKQLIIIYNLQKIIIIRLGRYLDLKFFGHFDRNPEGL